MRGLTNWLVAQRRPAAAGRHLLRRLTAIISVASAITLCLMAVPGPAQADSLMQTLCWQPDYSCTTGGYAGQPPSGWPNVSWNSAQGYYDGASVVNGDHHNCTLYAAYR